LNETVVVELFALSDENTINEIRNLELNAGYFLDQVTIDNEKFGIYIFSQNIIGDPLIESGDWAQFVSENRF
jgi:gamma-glutamylcyclotransferase (GGCT)/AIG2-like uncharacterized protein YtfP